MSLSKNTTNTMLVHVGFVMKGRGGERSRHVKAPQSHACKEWRWTLGRKLFDGFVRTTSYQRMKITTHVIILFCGSPPQVM